MTIRLESGSFFESPVPDEGRKRYFSGVIAGDRVTFTLQPFGEDYADVIEEFGRHAFSCLLEPSRHLPRQQPSPQR